MPTIGQNIFDLNDSRVAKVIYRADVNGNIEIEMKNIVKKAGMRSGKNRRARRKQLRSKEGVHGSCKVAIDILYLPL